VKDVSGRTEYQRIESAATFKAIFTPPGSIPPLMNETTPPKPARKNRGPGRGTWIVVHGILTFRPCVLA
jgi:hypothetical protein